MATNSVTLIDGTIAYAGDVEDKVNPLYVDIDNSNIAAGAGIVFSKLDAATVASVATSQTITGAKTFDAIITGTAGAAITGNSYFGTNLLYIDDTNNRIYEGTTTTTTIDSVEYQHQITGLSADTNVFALISTAASTSGVFEARYHNSASPADGDRIWDLGIYGKNDAATDIKYATIACVVDDVSAGTEDSHISIQAYNAGTLASRLTVYGDQVNVIPESLTVGTNTNLTPYGSGDVLGLYVKNTSSTRRVAFFESTDATANGIIIDCYKNSASPAASDVVSQFRFVGNDSIGTETVYSDIVARIVTTTNGDEDGQLDLRVIAGGTSATPISLVGTSSTGTAQIVINALTSTWDSPNTTGDALTLTASSLTTGSALVIYSNSASTSARNLVEIVNDNAAADSAACLYIQQDGDEYGIYVEQTGAVVAAGGFSSSSASASDNIALYAGASNSGAGNAVSILLGGSPNFVFEDVSGIFATGGGAGAYWGRFPVKNSGGSTKYVRLYDA